MNDGTENCYYCLFGSFFVPCNIEWQKWQDNNRFTICIFYCGIGDVYY